MSANGVDQKRRRAIVRSTRSLLAPSRGVCVCVSRRQSRARGNETREADRDTKTRRAGGIDDRIRGVRRKTRDRPKPGRRIPIVAESHRAAITTTRNSRARTIPPGRAINRLYNTHNSGRGARFPYGTPYYKLRSTAGAPLKPAVRTR